MRRPVKCPLPIVDICKVGWDEDCANPSPLLLFLASNADLFIGEMGACFNPCGPQILRLDAAPPLRCESIYSLFRQVANGPGGGGDMSGSVWDLDSSPTRQSASESRELPVDCGLRFIGDTGRVAVFLF